MKQRKALAGLAAGGLIAWAGFAIACAGGEWEPNWAIVTRDFQSYGDSAVMTPANDTRVNLLLLLADRHPQRTQIRTPDAPGGAAPITFEWRDLAALAAASADGAGGADDEWVEPSRCQSNAGGAAAFAAAVAANKRLTAAEKTALVEARNGLKPDCNSVSEGTQVPMPAVSSAAGKAFAAYLQAAHKFYAGEFDDSTAEFSALSRSDDPWLRETALYMVGRSALNRAQLSAFDEYGALVEPDKRDRTATAAAERGFAAYLAAYPNGRYAPSAAGLMRRVHWLAGADRQLAADYALLLSGKAARQADLSDVDLAEEIDLKFLAEGDRQAIGDPLLLAMSDLQRMRRMDYRCDRGPWCFAGIDKAEIERQRPRFGSNVELYDYVRAAEALFVRRNPREVLQIIPDASHQPSFTYLQFSRQMLRGFALEAIGDPNSRRFLLDLFQGAKQPFQRDALELVLAMHDERSGGLARVFAADSRVRNASVREVLLSYTAGPDLLRQQARGAAIRSHERDAALYILLSKELGHGLYADFLRDVRLVPAGAPVEGQFMIALPDSGDEPVPLGMFVAPPSRGDFACPALTASTGLLAQNPRDPHSRLCLAEFMRVNGFDWFPYDQPTGKGMLGSTPSLFPGKPYSRLEVYKSVIADASAAPGDRAYALFRAVHCYGPSGNNSCGGNEVDIGQRRAWFNQLKRDHPQSPWARALKYYW